MFNTKLIFLTLIITTGIFASGNDYTPFSENRTMQSTYAEAQTYFNLNNLWYSADFKLNNGYVSAEQPQVSYMARIDRRTDIFNSSTTEFGYGYDDAVYVEDGEHGSLVVYTSIPDIEYNLHSNATTRIPNIAIGDHFISKASVNVFTRGDFYYNVHARNLTDITFNLDVLQKASLSTSNGATGTAATLSSLTLYDKYNPFSPDFLVSETKYIGLFSGGANFNQSKESNDSFNLSYHFKKPYSGNLLLKGSFLNYSQAGATLLKHSGKSTAGAPEPSLFLSMIASLFGLFALKYRKNKNS